MNKFPKTTIKKFWEQILIRLFVDNIFLHKYVKCHRLSSRSFFVKNRQFHICARCTGLLVGYVISPIFLFWGELGGKIFILLCTLLILDGTTQLTGVRESNNTLRFITGFGTGATILSFLSLLIHHALRLR